MYGSAEYALQLRKEGEYYDAMIKCGKCGYEDDPVFFVKINQVFLCEDCFRNFQKSQFSEIGQEYIKTHSDEFVNWWWEGIEPQDRFRILWESYQTEKSKDTVAYHPLWERDFCLQSDDWRDFVKTHLERECLF